MEDIFTETGSEGFLYVLEDLDTETRSGGIISLDVYLVRVEYPVSLRLYINRRPCPSTPCSPEDMIPTKLGHIMPGES